MESIALYIKEENGPLFQKGHHIGIEQGVDKGLYLRAYQVVVSILGKFPDWKNEVIADLSQTDVACVAKVRKELFDKAQ
jgi:hypothetical protein